MGVRKIKYILSTILVIEIKLEFWQLIGQQLH